MDGCMMSEDDGPPDPREVTLVSEALLLMSSQPASSTPGRARTAARRSSPVAPAAASVAEFYTPLRSESLAMYPESWPAASAGGRGAEGTHALPSHWAPHHAPTALVRSSTDASGAHGGGDETAAATDADAHNSADAAAQWSAAEDQIMAEAVKRFGCKWSLISAFVGRSPASVRNRWHRMQRAARRRGSTSGEAAETDSASASAATRCLYQCSRCGMPKRGHTCMLTAGDAGQVQSACEAMNAVACEYGVAAAGVLPPAQ